MRQFFTYISKLVEEQCKITNRTIEMQNKWLIKQYYGV